MSDSPSAEGSVSTVGADRPTTITTNTDMNTNTPSNSDIVLVLTQARLKSYSPKYRSALTARDRRFIVVCSEAANGETRVDLGTVGEKTYDGFDYVSVLDTSNMVLTLNIVGIKTWRGISIFVEKGVIQKEGRYEFKLAFRSTSTTLPLKKNAIYPVPTICYPSYLLPFSGWAKKVPIPGPQAVPQSSATNLAKLVQAPPTGSSTSKADPTKLELKQDPAGPSSGSCSVLGFASLAAFMDTAHQRFQTIKLGPPNSISSEETSDSESDYDVHFYHHDPVSKTNNVIGAHRSVLSAYSVLSQFVDRTEALTRQAANEMHLTFPCPFPSVSQEQQPRHPHLLQKRPIIVNVSDFPFPTFRALVSYVYTKDIMSILLNISALELTYTLTALQDAEKEETIAKAAVESSSIETTAPTATMTTSTSTTLFIDELLLLAHMFEVRELFEMCVELTKMAITVENVVQVLVHLGTQFKEIKPHAMAFIKEHYHEVFGGLQGNPFKQLMGQKDGFQLMAEIMQMMATTKALETETNR